MKTEREMFVKKYREVFKVDKSLFVNDNGEFIDEFCQSVYEIWQSRVPEGYVVVPVEPSDYMKCTVRDFGPDIEDYENMSKWDWEKLCAEIYKAMIEAAEK